MPKANKEEKVLKVKKEEKVLKTKSTKPTINPDATIAAAATEKSPTRGKAKMQMTLVLRDVLGNEVDPKDYFYSDGSDDEAKRGFIPPYFNAVVGMPVGEDRQDLLDVFNKMFAPEDGFLFYKTSKKEVYVIIVPLRFSFVDEEHEPISGDFQKHAISFVTEGSATPQSLKAKLKRVAQSIKSQND